MTRLELNCDLGECDRLDDNSLEAQIMPLIDAANIACGFHAGNNTVMKQCIQLALQHQVKIGAHPSYPDRENFGRESMPLSPIDISDLVIQQLSQFDAIADDCGAQIDYVKPHGALYNDMMLSDAIMQAIIKGVQYIRPDLPLMIMATSRNSHYQTLADQYGISLIFEAFADRRYTDQGLLESRQIAGSVYSSKEQMLAQAKQLQEGFVLSASGNKLEVQAQSLCVHGDSENAIAFIQSFSQQ